MQSSTWQQVSLTERSVPDADLSPRISRVNNFIAQSLTCTTKVSTGVGRCDRVPPCPTSVCISCHDLSKFMSVRMPRPRRTSSNLGGDPRGDTGVPSMATALAGRPQKDAGPSVSAVRLVWKSYMLMQPRQAKSN